MQLKSFLCIPLLAVSMVAAGQQIELCGIKVSIGDDREAVERLLSPRCKTLRHPSEDMTFYWDRDAQGELSYKAGKVSWASRPSSVFRDSSDPVAVTVAFAKALQATYDSGGSSIKVSTTVVPLTDAQMTIFNMAFKDRNFSIVIKEGGRKDEQYVSITESIKEHD